MHDFVYSGLLSLLFITVYDIFYTELPFISCLTNLAVTVGGSCVWVLINNVRAEIADGSVIYQGGPDGVEICQEVIYNSSI